MNKEVVVISLGGSIIVPDRIQTSLLEKFKQILNSNKNKYKFVVVCGGGSIARKYISSLREINKSQFLQSMAGIAVTRMNARFMTYFFGRDASQGIPHDMRQVSHLLRKNDVVFCGALRYEANNTSDGTAAKIASFLKTDFINMTNVKGLYDKNPLTNKNARFISRESWDNFLRRVNKIKFKAGQHYVLDQSAAKIIEQHKIKTYIIGSDMSNLDKLLNKKKFVGTIIAD